MTACLCALRLAPLVLVACVVVAASSVPLSAARTAPSSVRAGSPTGGTTLAVHIVDPAGAVRIERRDRLALRVLVVTAKRVLPASAVAVRLQHNVTGETVALKLVSKLTVQFSAEDGGGWEHALVANLDPRKFDLGVYAFQVTVTIAGQQASASTAITVGIPLDLATLIRLRLLPDVVLPYNDLVTFDQAIANTGGAAAMYVDPANGKGYTIYDDPGRENILEKVLGRKTLLPATAPDVARAAELTKVLNALSWRQRYTGTAFVLRKTAQRSAADFTQAQCAGRLKKEAPVLYQVAQRKPAKLALGGAAVGLEMGLNYPLEGGAFLDLFLQRGYLRLADAGDAKQPAFTVDRAKLILTAKSAPPDLFDENSDPTHAHAAVKPVGREWTPRASDWDWDEGAIQLGSTALTTDEPRATVFSIPVSRVLAPNSTASNPIFRPAVAVQVRADEPGPGWPPKEAELRQSPLLCGWYRLAIGPSGGFPRPQVIYHQKFRSDPCDIPDGDEDGDGLPNEWECGRVKFPEGTLDLPALGASPRHRDLFVECDYMAQPGKNLQPRQEAIDRVVAAFADAPVENPDGQPGIVLHVDIGSVSANMPAGRQGGSVPFAEDWNGNPFDNGAFDAIKAAHFKPVRAHVFHYCVFANKYDPGQSSGIARGIPSDDFAVTLGSWSPSTSAELTQLQAGTFMHEFGHTLGLRHGGTDDLNYKPNYLSIMSYNFQLTGLSKNGSTGTLDYSRFDPILNERRLVEADGIPGPATMDSFGTTWSCPDGSIQAINSLRLAVDWNCDGDARDTVDQSVNRDGTKDMLESQQDWPQLVHTGGALGLGGVPSDTSATALAEIGPAEYARIQSALREAHGAPAPRGDQLR